MSAQSADHNGWVLCDGRDLDIAACQKLYDVLGASFGSDDASSFKLPDFRGRVPGMPSATRPMGAYVGAESHALTQNEMPVHSHKGVTDSDGIHSHAVSIDAAAPHTHTVNDLGHMHTQETVNDKFVGTSDNPPGFTTDSTGSKTWNNISSSMTGIALEASGSHSHAVSLTDAPDHAHKFTTLTAGMGMPHNIMQPTLFGINLFIFKGD